MTQPQDHQARLTHFRALYENAKNAYAPAIERYDRWMQQYRGSDKIDGSAERAGTVRNITYEIVESQVSSDIPQPKVDAACYSERRERNALAAERLCRSLRDKLSYEEMNDMDERYTYIYGGSVWYVEWENDLSCGAEIGGVRLHCLSPRDLIPQPNLCAVDDMEYCFLRFTTTRDQLIRQYGISREEATRADCESDADSFDAGEDTVSVIVTFYRDEAGDVGKFVFSGEVTLLDLPHCFRRKIRRCRVCDEREGRCRCERPRFRCEDEEYEMISRPDGEARRIRYYTPRSFPIVIRKNTSGEGWLFGQSDCEYIRPQQQAINKIESRILQKLLRAGITPIMPEDASISLNNAVFGQVIRMRPGESAAQYGKVDTTPDISQDVLEAERLYEHAKRTLGISDAFQGIDAGVGESGYARQLRISQASGRLESKRKMKHTAYADVDRLIFEHYLAFADEPRDLSYKDGYGRVQNAAFSREDFICYDPLRDEFYYDDAYLFTVDLNGGAEYQREALWERNLENLRSGTLGPADQTATLLRYWQAQERAHYPHARENVEYFTAALMQEREQATEGGPHEQLP